MDPEERRSTPHAGVRTPHAGVLLDSTRYRSRHARKRFPPRRGGIENLIGGLCRELKKKYSVKVVTTYSAASSLSEIDVFRAPLPGLFSFALYVLWRGTILLRRNDRITVVFGGSVLARTITLAAARSCYRTILQNILPASLRQAGDEIRESLAKAVQVGQISPADAEAALHRLEYVATVEEAARAVESKSALFVKQRFPV